MKRLAAFGVLIALGALALGACPGAARAQQSSASTMGQPEPLVQTSPRRARPQVPVRAQEQIRVRPRPQVRVTPRYPYRSYHTTYPLPYDYEYPGPRAKRDCRVRYVQEFRASGTVIVPRMNCWWVGG